MVYNYVKRINPSNNLLSVRLNGLIVLVKLRTTMLILTTN